MQHTHLFRESQHTFTNRVAQCQSTKKNTFRLSQWQMIPNYNFIAISLHGIANCSCLFDCLFFYAVSHSRVEHCNFPMWNCDENMIMTNGTLPGKIPLIWSENHFYFHACELKLVFHNQRLTRMHLLMEYWYIIVCCKSANAQHLKCQIMWLFQGRTANYNWIYNWNRDEVQNRYTN